MKTILVPTDFSPSAINAAYYAVDMAQAIGADILLLHAISFPMTTPEAPIAPEVYDAIIEDAKQEINKLRKQLSTHVNDKVFIATEFATDSLMGEIEHIATSIDVFAVVMGIQGAGATERFIFGSNTLNAIRTLQMPVIAVPSKAKFSKVAKVGLACDMHHAEAALPIPKLQKLMEVFNCSLDVLYVHKPEDSTEPETTTEAETLQNKLAQLHPEFHVINNKSVEQGIADFAAQSHIDLLLVIPQQHGIIGSIFHKSVAKQLAEQLTIPIMSIHCEPIPSAVNKVVKVLG